MRLIFCALAQKTHKIWRVSSVCSGCSASAKNFWAGHFISKLLSLPLKMLSAHGACLTMFTYSEHVRKIVMHMLGMCSKYKFANIRPRYFFLLLASLCFDGVKYSKTKFSCLGPLSPFTRYLLRQGLNLDFAKFSQRRHLTSWTVCCYDWFPILIYLPPPPQSVFLLCNYETVTLYVTVPCVAI